MKKVITGVIAVIFAIAVIGLGIWCYTGRSSGIELTFLHVENGRLVNENGEWVLLQGVNLGGWLVQENWMCPVSGENRKWANLDTLEVLESRFGEEKANELIETYQDNWITEYDIRNIAKHGCNVIRVPFWYRNFMKDTKGTWIEEDFDKNPGFKRLDWVIETAGKYGIYVILDMHGCPGGQSMDHSTGTLAQNDLYTDETCQKTMALLWTTIAERYADNPVVAAYDIMNEPQNNAGYEGENSYDPWVKDSWEMTNAIYQDMIEAIRKVDSRHVITVEGIWRASNLPDPNEAGWENVMYQIHLYDDDATFNEQIEDLVMRTKTYGVAGYVGEFFNLKGILLCKYNNLNWTSWSYKGTNNSGSSYFWYNGNREVADIYNDSYNEIKHKWGMGLRTFLFKKNAEVVNAVTEATQ